MGPVQAGAACETPYTNNELAEDIVAVRALFDDGSLGDARQQLMLMGEGLTCLDNVVEPGLVARFSQLMSMSYFFGQDQDQAIRWALLAHETGPDIPYEMSAQHPFMEMVRDLPEQPLGQIEGKQLAPPEQGAIFLNGYLALLPMARAEVPHLVQVFDDRGRILGGFWQEGAQFQDGLLAPGTGTPGKPRWFRGPIMDYGDAELPEGTANTSPSASGGTQDWVPAIVSGTLAATSIATLIGAAMTHASLEDQTTGEGLTRARTTTNALVVVSGISFVGASGVGVTLLIDTPGAGFTLRF